jgi:hypothetical protein
MARSRTRGTVAFLVLASTLLSMLAGSPLDARAQSDSSAETASLPPDRCPVAGDGPETACALANDDIQFGMLPSSGVQNVFRVDTSAEQTRLRVGLYHAAPGTGLYVTDQNLQVVTQALQDGPHLNIADVVLPAVGEYLVYVVGDPNGADGAGSAPYLLVVRMTVPVAGGDAQTAAQCPTPAAREAAASADDAIFHSMLAQTAPTSAPSTALPIVGTHPQIPTQVKPVLTFVARTPTPLPSMVPELGRGTFPTGKNPGSDDSGEPAAAPTSAPPIPSETRNMPTATVQPTPSPSPSPTPSLSPSPSLTLSPTPAPDNTQQVSVVQPGC